jgi:hypothetical protein
MHGLWLVAVVVHLKGIVPSCVLAVAALEVNAVVRCALFAVARTCLRRKSAVARAGIVMVRGRRGVAGARLRTATAAFAAHRPSAPWLAILAVGHRHFACTTVTVCVLAARGAGRLLVVGVLPTRALRARAHAARGDLAVSAFSTRGMRQGSHLLAEPASGACRTRARLRGIKSEALVSIAARRAP